MKPFTALWLFIFLTGIASAAADRFDQGAGRLLWERSIGGPGFEEAPSLAILPSGDLVIAGATQWRAGGYRTTPQPDSVSTSWDAWIVGLDAAANRKWDLTVGGTNFDVLTDIVATKDNHLLCIGLSSSPQGPFKSAPLLDDLDLWVVCLDVAGNRLWDIAYGGRWGYGSSVALDSADGFYVAGYNGSGNPPQSRLLHLDKSGGLLWEKGFSNALWALSSAVTKSGDSLFVGGSSKVSRLNPQDGVALWEVDIGQDSCTTICCTRDGGVVAGGLLFNPTNKVETSGWVAKFDREGRQLWRRETKPSGLMVAGPNIYSVIETHDGGFLVAGQKSQRLVLLRLGTGGEHIWEQSYYLGVRGHASQLQQLADGSYLVLADTEGPSPDKISPSWGSYALDFWLLKLAPETTSAEADPPVLSTSPWLVSYMGADGFHFSLIGRKGHTYVTQRSVNLTQWYPFSTNTVGATDVKLLDSAASDVPTYYRVQEANP